MRMADCHPDKPYSARGLCANCYQAWWRTQNPEKYREKIRRYRAGHTAERDEYKKNWMAKHPEKQAEYNRRSSIRFRFNISVEEYEDLLKGQGGGCAICGRLLAAGFRLVVDHDHACCPGVRSCGKCIRGVLCDLCNRGLGYFADDPQRLVWASDYIREYKKEVVG